MSTFCCLDSRLRGNDESPDRSRKPAAYGGRTSLLRHNRAGGFHYLVMSPQAGSATPSCPRRRAPPPRHARAGRPHYLVMPPQAGPTTSSCPRRQAPLPRHAPAGGLHYLVMPAQASSATPSCPRRRASRVLVSRILAARTTVLNNFHQAVDTGSTRQVRRQKAGARLRWHDGGKTRARDGARTRT
jgi:hypothetical protein